MSTNLEQVHRAAPTKPFFGCFFPLAHSTFRIVAICVLNCRKCGRTEASSAFALGAPFLIRLWPYLVFSKNVFKKLFDFKIKNTIPDSAHCTCPWR